MNKISIFFFISVVSFLKLVVRMTWVKVLIQARTSKLFSATINPLTKKMEEEKKWPCGGRRGLNGLHAESGGM